MVDPHFAYALANGLDVSPITYSQSVDAPNNAGFCLRVAEVFEPAFECIGFENLRHGDCKPWLTIVKGETDCLSCLLAQKRRDLTENANEHRLGQHAGIGVVA